MTTKEEGYRGNCIGVKGAAISFEKNSFDLLRLYAAFAVMFLHFTSFYFMYAEKSNPAIVGIRESVLCFHGVIILFAMSGFLNAASYDKTENGKVFLKKKLVRLYPELWVCTLVNLCVVSILVWELLDGGMIVWLITQFFGISITPSCLEPFGTGSVNGSLWTVFVELQLYVVTAFGYKYLKRLSVCKWVMVLAMALVANLVTEYITLGLPEVIQKAIGRTFIPYVIWYLAGVFCYCQREVLLPLLKKYCVLLLILYGALYRIDFLKNGFYCGMITSVLFPFVVIGAAYALPKIRLKKDISYGMFLYHWIVINVFVHFDIYKKLHWAAALLIFVAVSVILGWLSTILVGEVVKNYCKNRQKAVQ